MVVTAELTELLNYSCGQSHFIELSMNKKNVLKKIAEGIRRTCYCLLRICVLNKTIEIANPLTCC